MKFELTKTSEYGDITHKLSKFSKVETLELTCFDFRTVKTIAEAREKYQHWFNEWYDRGFNHREEKGMIVCDRKQTITLNTIEVDNLDELINIIKVEGEIVICDTRYKELPLRIEIYDGYRE